jgi:DNA-binding NarL/FixJ family response regulator
MSPPVPSLRRVVIVEDHSALHGMMRAVVESVPGFRVAGYAKDLASARELCRREKPALVILDLGLPQGSGLTLLPELRTLSPLTRVMIFSGNLRAATIRAALLSGAHGLVEKTASLEEFEQALRAIGSGQVYFSRFASEEIRSLVQRRAGGPPPIVRLTEREKAVLRAVAEGLSSKQISSRLGLSPHTVVNHRTRLAKKIRVRGVAQLSRYAVQIGLLGGEVEGAADATAD